jgi:hypothetical protein
MQGETTSNDLGEMQEKAMTSIREARGTIEEFARENPRAAIGIAVGVGFVLGGGLTPRLLFGLGALAARTVARDYVKGQLGSFTGNLLGGESRGEAE